MALGVCHPGDHRLCDSARPRPRASRRGHRPRLRRRPAARRLAVVSAIPRRTASDVSRASAAPLPRFCCSTIRAESLGVTRGSLCHVKTSGRGLLMKLRTIVLLLAVGIGASILLAWRAEETPLLADQVLTVPPGFEVERVAGPPQVNRPIVADFDEEGRLYVADSSGSNDKVELQLKEKPHRIVRLEDKDGDGRFDDQHRLRRQDDVPRRCDVAGRFPLCGSAAEHLEAHGHRWLTALPTSGRSGFEGKTLTDVRQRSARAVSRPRRAGFTGRKVRSRSRPTSVQASRRW